MIDTTTPISKVKKGDIEIPLNSANPYEDVIDNQKSTAKGQYLFAGCQDDDIAFANHFTSSVKSKIVNLLGTFYSLSNITSLDLTGINITGNKSLSNTFRGLSGVTSLDLSPLYNITVTASDSMFQGCSALQVADISFFNSNKTLNTSKMFYGCNNLQQILYAEQVFSSNDCTEMFANISNVTSITVKFGTPTCMKFNTMFGMTGSQTSLLSTINIEKSGYNGFRIPDGADINKMFRRCLNLQTINTYYTLNNWKSEIEPYAVLFDKNALSQSTIYVICADGVLTYNNNGDATFSITESYALRDNFYGTYSDGTTTYAFDTSNKQVTVNGITYDYTINSSAEITVADLGLTFTMTAEDGSGNCTQLTDNNSNVYTFTWNV